MQQKTIKIKNMHCASCNILVQEKLKNAKNVVKVEANFAKKTADIYYTGHIDLAEVATILECEGYSIELAQSVATNQSATSTNRLVEFGVISAIIVISIYFINEFKLLNFAKLNFTSSPLSLFVLGAVASLSTCMATTGALFTSYLADAKPKNPKLAAVRFVFGRVMAFILFGLIIGLLGKNIFSYGNLGNLIQVLAACALVLAGLDILHILQLGRVVSSGLFAKIYTRAKSKLDHKFYPALLGFITYFLPCGFAITAHSLAVTNISIINTPLLLGSFALGTAPSVLLVSQIARIKNINLKQTVFKFIGVFTVLLGIYFIYNILSIYGILPHTNDPGAPVYAAIMQSDGKQHIKMNATANGFSPNIFEVKVNVPVIWETNGVEVYGCQGSLQSPNLNIPLQEIKLGQNVIEFTPKKLGLARFSCSMGMFGGVINVVE